MGGLGLALFSPLAAAGNGYAVYTSAADFDDVRDGLKFAIEERGMVINNVLHLSQMLERTGKDLGPGPPLYQRAESVEFCSAVLARAMTSEDPARLVNCPFIISVYTLPQTVGTTFVAHRAIPLDQLQGSAVMARVAAMLKDVAAAAVNW
jgi:uncharacterized protein (DUF302 family)